MSKLNPSATNSTPSMHSRAEHLEHRVHVGHALLVEDVEGPREEQLGDVHRKAFTRERAKRRTFQSSSPSDREPSTKLVRRWTIGSSSAS